MFHYADTFPWFVYYFENPVLNWLCLAQLLRMMPSHVYKKKNNNFSMNQLDRLPEISFSFIILMRNVSGSAKTKLSLISLIL
jgi:hypothetical protein